MSVQPKLIVTGHKNHGKDTVCEIIESIYKLKFTSSSMILAEEVVYPVLGPKYGYKTVQECFDDRDAHRKEWFDLLAAYNAPDATKLGRLIFEQSDVYCGLRNIRELIAMDQQSIFDFTIWVDALDRLPPESKDSMTITIDDCDYIIDNNGPEEELESRVIEVMDEVMALFKYGIVL